jgi:hypothetical protein
MIPASYLYKDIYRQTWLDPDLECTWARQEAARLKSTRSLRQGLSRLLHRLADMLYPAESASLIADHS